MEKNSDKRIVVLDIEMFARLLAYADIGEAECGMVIGSTMAEIKRHVNKQNTFLHEARERTALKEGEARKKLSPQLRRKARAISERHTANYYMMFENTLIPVMVTISNCFEFHKWGSSLVSIRVKNLINCVSENIPMTDLLMENEDMEYINNLIENEGYVYAHHN